MAKQVPNQDDFTLSTNSLQGLEKLITPFNPLDDVPKDPTMPGAYNMPFEGAGMPSIVTTEGMTKATNDLSNNLKNTVTDPFVKSKAQRFNAGLDGLQFERYYKHPKFDSLGFTPFRDNESFYNENSNIVHDMGRTLTQFKNLAGIGMMDAVGFGSLTDSEMAKKYEKAMVIGSSSREGVGAFANNLFLNAGYSIGIISEIALEEAAMAAITALTFGAAAEVTIPAMIARGVRASNKLSKGYSVGKNIMRTLNNLKDANKARKYFTQAIKGTGKFLNPAENTLDFMQGMSKLDNMTDLAKTAQGFGAFYRDVRSVRLAWGEAGLEGGMVQNDLEKELLAEHYEKTGKAPTNEEADAIKETAHRAGNTAGYQNVGAIYFSNKIVFDNLFSTFKPIRRLTDDFIDAGVAGKIIRNKTLDKDPFEAAAKGVKGLLKTAKNPKAYARTALSYFKANVAEGLQETAQETISGAAKDYYTAEWRGTPLKGGYYASITDNLQKQVTTAEGLEVFMSGFLMGGMLQPVMKAPSYIKDNIQKFTKPAEYQQRKAEKEEYLNKTINMLNDMWNNTGDILAPDLENLAAQAEYSKGIKKASESGDGKAYHDLKDDAYYEHIINAIKHGRMDTFIERLEDQKQLSAEEIKETYNMTPEQFIGGMDSAIARAKRIETRYNTAMERMPNPFNPNTLKKGGEAYNVEMINKRGWEDAQKQFIFLQHSFDRTLERMTSIMGEAQADAQLSKVSTADFNTLFRLDTIDSEIKMLTADIDSTEGIKGKGFTDVTKQRNEKKKKLKLLTDFAEKMSAVKISGTESVEAEKEQQKVIKKAKTSYNRYLKNLASVSNDYAFDDALDNSFQKLVDYYMLNGESAELNHAVNTMLNPGYFSRVAARAATIRTQREAQGNKERADSLKEYVKAMDTSRLMQVLYEKGMFFDPEELGPLLEKGVLPTKFYYVTENSSDAVEVVEFNSPDYVEAINTVKEFVKVIMDIPISEATPDPYHDATARPKTEDDKRTYDDYAKQYGFDPNSKETKVPLKQVLETVIESEYIVPEEKHLAQQLLRFATDSEFVTFINYSSTPGSYSPSTQSIVDARYSSHNYKNGVTVFEHVILHEEIHRRTTTELKTDGEFRKSITDLLQIAQDYHKETKGDTKPLYGLANEDEFVAEALSNSTFQKFLSEIPFDVTGATTWTKFVDSVLSMLKKLMGKNIDNSVLNQAMNIITTKIDSSYTATPEDQGTDKIDQQKIEPTDANTKITTRTPLGTLVQDHPALLTSLIQAYKDKNRQLISAGNDPFDPEFDTKSSEDIIKSNGFKKFFVIGGNQYAAVKDLLNDYNERTGRDVEPVIAPVSDGGVTIMSIAMRTRLEELGYDPKKLTISEAEAVIARGLTMKESQEVDELAVQLRSEVLSQAKETMRVDINALLESANTIDELILIEDEIARKLDEKSTDADINGWDLTEYTGSDINELVKARKNELAFSFEFDDIYPGMTVILTTNQKMIVDRVVGNNIHGHLTKDVTKKRRIAKSKLKDRIKYIFNANIMNEDVSLPTEADVTPADQTKSNETQANIDNTNDRDSIIKDWNSSEDGDEAFDPNC